MKMKLTQKVTRQAPGTFETTVTIIDEAGNEKEMKQTYTKTNSIYPAYKSFITAIQPLEDVTIQLTSSHAVFLEEVSHINDLNSALATILSDLLNRNNITVEITE